MELPNLGKHCQETNCKMLDFLPFKCDSCKKIFCKDHYSYNSHVCCVGNFRNRDFQMPLCPLCNQPVPYRRTELPDAAMSSHIDRDCQSDPAEERRKKIYNNKCFLKGCKNKELIPFTCSRCNLNYCLRHRHEEDHECSKIMPEKSKPSNDINSKRLQFFQKQHQPPQTTSNSNSKRVNEIQPKSLTESEALEYAIKLSLNENKNNKSSNTTGHASASAAAANSTETEDEVLARVLAQSELEYQNIQRSAAEKKDACSIN